MFIISETDLETHETLEKSDLGRPAILIRGCIMIMQSEEKAKDLERLLKQDNERGGMHNET